VTLCGLTAGPIPWPVGRRGRTKAIVLCAGLSDAVRRESALAVAHHWGVTGQTVTAWRKALGVGAVTEGTSRLKRERALEPDIAAARARGQAKAGDPGRRAKIAAARRGKPRPRHVIEAMRKGRTGKPQTEETRRKIGEAVRRLGIRPPKAGRPWTPQEDKLARTLPAKEAARRTGRTVRVVRDRRRVLAGMRRPLTGPAGSS
jgi:hypothetical protein